MSKIRSTPHGSRLISGGFFSAKSPLLGIKIQKASSRLLGQPLLHQARLKASSSFGQPEKKHLEWRLDVQWRWKTMENHGKTMENLGKTMENLGKPWKNHGKTMENLGKPWKKPWKTPYFKLLTIKIRCESMVYWGSS